jgi:hypothetical protein
MQAIDIYTHIFPDKFYAELTKSSPKLGNIGARLRGIPPLFDLDVRFRAMDKIGADYQQIISLPNTPWPNCAIATKTASRALPPPSPCTT